MSARADLVWRWRRFDDLGVRELQHIYAARQRVFAVEQQCVYLDVDGCDESAWHLAAWSPAQREPLAYARVLDPGVHLGLLHEALTEAFFVSIVGW